MKYIIGLLFGVCLLSGYFVNEAHCRPSSDDENADPEYLADTYDYEDYEDKTSSGEQDPTLESKTAAQDPPFFEQTEYSLHARPGEHVVLNCDVRNFQISNVVVWYNGSTVLTNGQVALSNQVEGMRNNSLLIKHVQAHDAGDYYCEVLPQKIRLHATLTVGGRLAILCDGREVTNRSIILRQGDKHSFDCQTYVSGPLKIKWSFNGQRAENVVTKVDGGRMYIDNIDSEHAGVYQCLGDDGSSKPPHGVVTIDVHYSPKVFTHRHHVNTEQGASAELYCDYKASPIAITRWLKNGIVLSYSDKYAIENMPQKHHNRTVLTVKDVGSIDLGEYVCQVENTIGSNEMKVHLIYEPEHPQFENMEINGNVVTLHWLVRSLQPLSEAVLDYQMTGTYSWSTVSMIHTKPHGTGIWKLTHEMELMPGEWHARVKTKNTIGWSKFSAQHDFAIKDDVDDEENVVPGYEIPADNIVQAAGIGLGGGGNAKVSGSARLGGTPLLLLLALATGLWASRTRSSAAGRDM